jgi:hypothetical protein
MSNLSIKAKLGHQSPPHSNEKGLAAVAGAGPTDVDHPRDTAVFLGKNKPAIRKKDPLFQIMGDKDHCNSLFPADAGKFLLHGQFDHRVQRAEGFIEEKEFRVHGQR